MKQLSITLLLVPFLGLAATYGQSVARLELPSAETTINESRTEVADERILTARAIVALKRLDKDVLIYRSLGDFEENGKLACVSFETFKSDLQEVAEEVERLLARLPQSKIKTEIANALDSYNDGAFWWRKIDRPQVVHVSALTSEFARTPADAGFLSTVPYTVAIHWRQAHRFLSHAEKTLSMDNNERSSH